MVINFFVFTQPRDKPLSQLIGRRTAKGRDQPAIAKALKTAYSLKLPLRLLHKHFFHDQGGSPAHELWIGNPKLRHK